jgi:hypothetical protein
VLLLLGWGQTAVTDSPYAPPITTIKGAETGMTLDELREQIIALQQELTKAWEAAVDAEDKLEDQGKLDGSPLTSVPLQAANDAANACRLAIESAMFRAAGASDH